MWPCTERLLTSPPAPVRRTRASAWWSGRRWWIRRTCRQRNSTGHGHRDKGTRRQGDKEITKPTLRSPVSLSPCPLVSLSPCLLVPLSPCPPVPVSCPLLENSIHVADRTRRSALAADAGPA